MNQRESLLSLYLPVATLLVFTRIILTLYSIIAPFDAFEISGI